MCEPILISETDITQRTHKMRLAAWLMRSWEPNWVKGIDRTGDKGDSNLFTTKVAPTKRHQASENGWLTRDFFFDRGHHTKRQRAHHEPWPASPFKFHLPMQMQCSELLSYLYFRSKLRLKMECRWERAHWHLADTQLAHKFGGTHESHHDT